MESILRFIVGTMVWSFSRLSSFYNCKKEWQEQYINSNRGANSCFGQFGSYCHQILEKFAKGELKANELADYYKDNYTDNVNLPFPPNSFVDLEQKYYDIGLEYFEKFNIDLSPYEILGVEKKVEFEIDGKEFIGFIDLLLRDKQTGEITILDHKSATIKILKSGKISKSDQEHFEDFKRQLYLYSIPIIQEYGSVSKLKWNMFRQGNYIEIPWKQEEYDATIQWAKDTLKMIENETEFRADPDEFYCRNLCSLKNEYCPYRRLCIIYNRITSKCYSKKNAEYDIYGGLGVEICDEWRTDPHEFYRWALENGYDDDLVLKRYDPFGNFDFINCYWDYPEESYAELS